MITFVTIFTAVLDMLVLYIFIDGILQRRKKNIPFAAVLLGLILTEVIIYITSSISASLANAPQVCLNNGASFLTTFCLCFFYQTTVLHSIFVAIAFQILVPLSEYGAVILIRLVNPDFFSNPTELCMLWGNLNSKLLLLLFASGCVFFWARKFHTATVHYNPLIFVTPVASMLMMLIATTQDKMYQSDSSFTLSAILLLIIMNISNYILLCHTQQVYELRAKNTSIGQQLSYQSDKYAQLNEAYRNTRRMIHDTKVHYFAIQEYIKKEDYGKLSDYLTKAMDSLESSYAKHNTGNLVIDALLTNCETMARSRHIAFSAELEVNCDQVPVNDYDLCVILGNLLDNSIHACYALPNPKEGFIRVEIRTDNHKKFRIHISNNFAEPVKNKNPYFHGYGLKNVEIMAEKYNGIFHYKSENHVFDAYVLIPIF